MEICNHLIPAISSKCDVSGNVRDVLALPSHLGGLGMAAPGRMWSSVCSLLQSLQSARSADHSSFTFPTRRNLRKAEGMQEGKQSREEQAYSRWGGTTAASSIRADKDVGSWKGSIQLVVSSANLEAWVLPAHGYLSRCNLPEVQMDTWWCSLPPEAWGQLHGLSTRDLQAWSLRRLGSHTLSQWGGSSVTLASLCSDQQSYVCIWGSQFSTTTPSAFPKSHSMWLPVRAGCRPVGSELSTITWLYTLILVSAHYF